jgi:hypothetical protein
LLAVRAPAQNLVIVHKNIGQGDATLILGPPDGNGNRVTVLVDSGDIRSGGDPDGVAIVLNELRDLCSLSFPPL